MPKYHQSITLNGIDKETALAIAYLSMQHLQWNILYAGKESLAGSTIKNWKNNSLRILCTVNEDHLSVQSEMINNELFDIAGKNKKNTEVFLKQFESIKSAADTGIIEKTKEAINSLREVTIKTAGEHQQQAEELDKAMNLSGSNLYATYAIIILNVLVFILMALNGAGIFEADGYTQIKWGSNYTPLTLSGDWWRLFSNIFIHFGIIHLAMNMYCLYSVGIYLEPMLGKARYTVAYICTGILASIMSLWWHAEDVNSAGASGAIFGIYGLFLALLTTTLIPKQVRQALIKSIGIFVAYNLIYGMKSGVDNAAHAGGLISGFIIGYGYVYNLKKEKQELKVQWLLPGVILLTLIAATAYLGQHKVSDAKRMSALNEVTSTSFKDNDKFNQRLGEFDEIHKTINDIVSDTALEGEKLKNKIDEVGFPQWQVAAQAINVTTKYDISPASHAKAEKLARYITLRKNELEILKEMVETKNYDKLIPELNTVREKANLVFEEAIKM